MTEKRLFGQLFLPNSEEVAFNAAWLHITESEIYFEAEINTLGDKNWKILKGVFNGMDKVTLVNCDSGSGSSGRGGTWRKVWVSYLIKGIHINEIEGLTFKKIILSNPSLNKWVISPNHIDHVDDRNFIIPPKEIISKFKVDDFSVSIFLDYSRSSGFRSLSLERKCYVEIISKKKTHVNDFSEITTKLKKLILFLTNKNPEYDAHYLSNEDGDSYELVNEKNDLREERFSSNLEFRYGDIKEDLAVLCANWFLSKKLNAIVDLSLEKHFNVDLSFQGYFLNMCVAIESFHTNFSDTSEFPEVLLKTKNRQVIIDLIEDGNLRQWFKQQSTFWKNPTLFERLTSFSKSIEKIIQDNINCTTEKFILNVKRTRNDIAHKGEYENHLTHFELFLYGKVLELILRIEILKSLGIQDLKNKDLLVDSNKIIKTLVRINEYK